MLNIELESLRPQELQRLIAAARSRGQTEFEAELLAEVARRSGRIDVRPVIAARSDAAAAVRARRPRVTAFAGMAATILVAGGLGWAVAPVVLSRFAAPAPAPAQRNLLAYEAVGAPASTPAATVAEAASLADQAGEEQPPSAGEPVQPPPQRLAVALTATPSAAIAPTPATAAAHKASNPCLSLPTPGERLVCGYPSLAIQDRRLQKAFERALSAGADPQAVEAAKSQWRQTRDRVWDREQLADLYAQRLREIENPAASKAENGPF